MKERENKDVIESEASLWAARLNGGNMSDADQANLSDWLKADKQHVRCLNSYRMLAEKIDTCFDVQLASAAAAATKKRIRSKRRSIAIIVSAAAAIAVLFAFEFGNRTLEIATISAERLSTTLEDGSRVELNANTKLIVDFSENERRIRLEKGEAMFEVKKDAQRAFIVDTKLGSIRVTGTVFNVRSLNDSSAEVTVLEGHVQVQPAEETANAASLMANEQAILSRSYVATATLENGEASDAVAWRQGQVVFDDTPLGEAIERFANYHSKTITVDRQVANLRLGGRYSLKDLEGLLDSLEIILPVRISRRAVSVKTGLLSEARSEISYLVEATPEIDSWSE